MDHSGGRMQEELFRLRALVRSFELLNSSLDLDTVLDRTLHTSVGLLKAEMGSVALLSDDRARLEFVRSTDPEFEILKRFSVPIDQGIAGYVVRHGEPVRVEDMSKDSRFYREIDRNMKHETRTYLCVPLKMGDEVIGSAQLMNRLDGKPFNIEDEELFLSFARQASIAIHNARMHRVSLKQQAMDTELRVCTEIQSRLFPEKTPGLPHLECFGESQPSREVGGDYYTFMEQPDGGLDVALGDVSGKGIPAALLVSELHTGIHLLSRMDRPLDVIVRDLNNHLVSTILVGKFITFFIARFQAGSGHFEYVNAGHPAPMIVRTDGKVEELERTGVVLGMPDNPIEKREAWIDPGELLFIFSDAYSESKSPDGELFGEERIARVLGENRNLSLPDLAAKLKQVTREFRSGLDPDDDATMILVRRI